MTSHFAGNYSAPVASGADDERAIARLALAMGFLQHHKRRDITFDETILTVLLPALIEVLDADHATLWARRQDKYCMAYSTLPDRLTSELMKRRAPGESRTGLCFRTKCPAYYPSLTSEPACVFEDLLSRERFQAKWSLPIPVEGLSSELEVPCVVTVDGVPGQMLSDLSRAFLDQVSGFIGQGITHALWAEQDALYRGLRHSIDCLDASEFDAVDDLARRIRKALCFEACTILVANEQTRSLLLAGTTGLTACRAHGTTLCQYDEGLTGRAISDMKVIAVEGTQQQGGPLSTMNADELDAVADQGRAELLLTPIVGIHQDRMGVVRLRNKKPPAPSTIQYPLNVLDEQRIEKVAEVIAPLLKLIQEHRQREAMVRSIRHDVEIPAIMIKGVVNYYRTLFQESPSSFGERLDWRFERKLKDCEAVCEILIRMGDMARLSSEGQLELRLDEKVSVYHEVILPLCKMLEWPARKKGIQCIYYDEKSFNTLEYPGVTQPSALPHMWVDQALITIALYNIMQNAIKYSVTGGPVKVRADYDADCRSFVISVSNIGIEIPPNQSERIFEPFFRTIAARRKSISGMGMGLTYARAIARLHGGDATLLSQSPTTFGLSLPLSLASGRPV